MKSAQKVLQIFYFSKKCFYAHEVFPLHSDHRQILYYALLLAFFSNPQSTDRVQLFLRCDPLQS